MNFLIAMIGIAIFAIGLYILIMIDERLEEKRKSKKRTLNRLITGRATGKRSENLPLPRSREGNESLN